MNVTQQDVLDTAELLNVDIDEKEIETITKAFSKLIAYFDVLDQAVSETSDNLEGDDIARFRDGHAIVKTHTEELIEKSEEYEDNYVLIPNIL